MSLTNNRLLRRLWLFFHVDLMSRELEFHREHIDEASDEGLVLWHLDDEVGSVKID